ncbi:DNA-binding response regulator [Aliidiomarina minuta]|uniref:DNA-binding response regulator n=1 Tax=Aliidiomarina minuta TaxID=880057 RepID=A0A432W4Z9_9GAMM|nr:response regulator transcription factor [Aliidiomarina minuta]RUO24539.1 DNA-binding response regulator [Aliidiomarina minuta]
MARAIIADDHPLFRAALRQALSSSLDSGILEVASFSQLESLLHEAPQVELVFLDLNMPGNQGLTGLTAIRNQFPDVLVVVVSANEQLDVIQRALDFGASAYIPKSVPLESLKLAVETVLAGDTWIPPHLTDAVKAGQQSEKQSEEQNFARQLEQLTPQQFKVLQCIADGLLNKQIAYQLNVQETTIKQHVSAILRKLGVINRTQAGIIFRQMLRAEEE